MVQWKKERAFFTSEQDFIISGKLEFYKNKKQIIHPQHIALSSKNINLPNIESVYSLTQGLTNKVISNHIKRAVDIVPNFNEWQDKEFFKSLFNEYGTKRFSQKNEIRSGMKMQLLSNYKV